jgi:WD40 repeat protein
VWNAATGALICELRGSVGGMAVSLIDDARRALTAGTDGTARIWDASLTTPVPVPSPAEEPSAWTVADRWAWRRQGTSDRAIEVLDRRTGRTTDLTPRQSPFSIRFAASSPVMAVTPADPGPVDVYQLQPTRLIGSFSTGRGLTCTALSPSGALLVLRDGGSLWLWDTATHRRLRRLAPVGGYDPSTCEAAVSPDSQTVVAIDGTGLIALWRVSDGRMVARVRGEPSPGFNASAPLLPVFSPDGSTFIAAGNWEHHVVVRRVADGQPVASLGHVDARVAFSPTAPLVVSDAGTVWDAGSGREIAQLPVSDATGTIVGFTADGRRVTSLTATWACDVCGTLADLLRLANRRVTRSFTPAERARFLQ